MSSFFATSAKGIEQLLADELMALGATSVKQTRAGVAFEGSLEVAYRVCLWSRLASRILMPVSQFEAPSSDALYEGVQRVRWNEHLGETGTLAVAFTSHADDKIHTQFAALKVKDAIVDQMRDLTGSRPSVDVERPDVRVNVHLAQGMASVAIDLSGESLHRRGWRGDGGNAPLKENLAAAVVMRAKPSRDVPLVDPMCGSGTLLIEGATMLADIAPGLGRTYFGFTHWRGHDAALWERLSAEADERRAAGLENLPPILGFDADERAVQATLTNSRAAGVGGKVQAIRANLGELKHSLPPGLVVVNPPYGVRIADDEGRALARLYEELGNVLKGSFPGWRAGVFVAQGEVAGSLRLRASKRYSFFNGSIPCFLFLYEMGAHARGETKTSEGEQAFANRLRKNHDKFSKWAKSAGLEAYRVYDADIPEYALAVDMYGKRVHVQEYAPPKTVEPRVAQRRLREALHAIPDVLGVDEHDVFVKVSKQQKGDAQYERHETRDEYFEVRENGHAFLVNLSDFLDTGLFLDHRDTRAMVGELSRGKRFLNLFAYTCTASVYAARAGASSTTSVDASRTYLGWAEANFEANGMEPENNRLVQDDVIAWLDESRPGYDVIFVDPPTFSNSKDREQDFDVQRDHVNLLDRCAHTLSQDGVIVFSNNYRRFKLDFAQLEQIGLIAEDITTKTIPRDFERNARIHQCFLLRKK
ncbi:MAG: bifunctional 23S rRNA (guanine(2069)-N(7))-methyltransferase RlmK/23S rRNA (guanine(2445)-N(2))-methyltransferase RlmL [Clostridia bacterium]|nr:bifunctional 23S rRNA (guanine(2069)-N(7))-methyltransferase RlmK/23S rRNA (guanine(2445)-N(2))-methyltransferase RlmL [Deltaproteobacteria bacterium]